MTTFVMIQPEPGVAHQIVVYEVGPLVGDLIKMYYGSLLYRIFSKP